MKTIVRRILAVALAVIMMIAVAPPIAANAAEKSLVYVSLGDSLTDYATYQGKSWTSYPVYVSETVTEKTGVRLVVKNDAKGGFTADDVISQLATNKDVIEDIKTAETVSVMIGGNDMIAAITLGLMEKGYDLYSLLGNGKLTSSSAAFKTAYNILNDKNNAYHKAYITGINTKIRNIVSTIQSYNSDCKIAIATMYYNDRTGIGYIGDVTGMSVWDSYLFSVAYSTAIREIQGYFKAVANENPQVTYVDVDKLADAKYIQKNDSGDYVDFHPNEAGQRAFADCFYNDFWSKIDVFALAKEDTEPIPEPVTVATDYEFYAIDNANFLAANAVIGDELTLKVNDKGIGSKLYCRTETDARVFDFSMKSSKAAGVITGISFWDNTNKSEILIRVEGTDTKNLVVCAGGNGQYVSARFKLKFDAYYTLHDYHVEFDDKTVTVKADDKVLGSLDISGVTTPVSVVRPIVFIQKADWAGVFEGKKVKSVFSNIH